MVNPLRNILVAVNHPAADTLPAATKAARIARACGARLELFHAIEASVYADNPAAWAAAALDTQESQRQHYLQRLKRIAARLRLHGVQVSTAVEYDYPPGDAIIRRAGIIQADLIVARRNELGPRTLSHSRRTDWELLRHSPIPVLLVRRSRLYHHPAVLAAVDPARAHCKPAQLDEAILGIAEQLTHALGGKLHAVHAYTPTTEARTCFEQLVQGHNVPPAQRHLVEKRPAAAISDTARRTHAVVVVMGAVSRSGLKGFFIGNTAERILRDLPCDVLIVKPAQFKTGVSSQCSGLRIKSSTTTLPQPGAYACQTASERHNRPGFSFQTE